MRKYQPVYLKINIPMRFGISSCPKIGYRLVSILSNISKIYERCIYDQIQLLITLIEKWKKSVDNGGAFGALPTDLTKAFDCLPQELLIAKLDAYGFDKSSLKLIHK